MKNKLLIIALVIVLLAISIYLIFLSDSSKTKDSTKEKEETIEITNLYDEDESIEWSDYEGNEIELTGSIKITEGGIYTLTGTINDGLILIDTEDEVKLILNNVNIKSSNSPAILVEGASLVEIELKEGSENYLEDGISYISEYTDYNGVIYSKDDLVLSGTGKLTIKSQLGDAIVSKDNLKIVDGTYIITSSDDAIKGKDSLYILNGNFDITSGGDGLKSTNDEDDELGYIYISNGIFNIESKGDGIDAYRNVIINDGNININSSDDGIHADEFVEINGSTINITAKEGIEGTYVKINSGTININASDDGINAAEKSTKYTPTVEVNGGNITIKMGAGDTDGVDSNGDIIINGGTINVTGQSTFDYDGKGIINGGTVICNGTEVKTLPNQIMGGPGGNQGIPQGGPQRNGGRY